VIGAASFGFCPLWDNRARMPGDYSEQPPLRVVANLSALPSLTT